MSIKVLAGILVAVVILLFSFTYQVDQRQKQLSCNLAKLKKRRLSRGFTLKSQS